ncbi:MAG: TetR/AcrR family transcriptional regulator [Cyanothece sp. SIO2G6]|nr:TetR/AcrR family transcriptional regulator [Cyanothece sp. SIO2G6]
MPKASYHHGDLRNSQISAGLKILREEDVHALSLRRVAREADVSAAAPYRHFKDKQALMAALSESGFRKLRSMLITANEEKPGDIDHSGAAYLEFAQKHPEQYRLMFTHNLLCGEGAEEALQNASSDAFGTLIETIEIGILNGKIAETNSSDLAFACWSLVHGLAMLLIDGILTESPYGDLPAEKTLELCQSYFRKGWQTLP